MYTRRSELDSSFGPYEVSICDTNIKLEDGTLLSTKFWFPGKEKPFEAHVWTTYCASEAEEDTGGCGLNLKETDDVKEDNKKFEDLCSAFPTILEFLPYCKNLYTAERDHLRHPWMASHGYVVMRPDMRGSGDSTGFYYDEYDYQEQKDACELIAWISSQPWSNGSVGMYGKSWGGFNGLQVAFEQPPALKAIISLFSTDNRYTDDVHWKGGSVVASQMLSWSAIMFAWNARPPHPKYFAGSDWKKTWKERLENASKPWTKKWLEHQTYDEYWKHGSVCEDYERVKIPTLAIGGWHDLYTNALFRMVEKLPNCRGIIGPWSHNWPDESTPGPQIGFMDECLDFWNHHLKGKSSLKQTNAPKLIWYQCFGSIPPVPQILKWPGFWYSRNSDVMTPDSTFKYYLNEGHLLDQQDFCGSKKEWACEYDANSGWSSGEMLSFGGPDLPGEQSFFNNPKTTWKSQRLQRELDLLGFSAFACQFQIHNDTQGTLIVKLCDEFPDGQTRLIAFGVLNLTQYQGDTKPEQLRTGSWYDASVEIDAIGYRMLQGHRIVLNISCSYWPMIWTPRRCTNISFRKAHLSLPIIHNLEKAEDTSLFLEPKFGPALEVEQIKPSNYERNLIYGLSSMERSLQITEDDGIKRHVQSDIIMGETSKAVYSLKGLGEPLTAKAHIERHISLKFEASSDHSTDAEIYTSNTMTSDMDNFYLEENMKVFLNGDIFFENTWKDSVPRIFS